MIRQAPCGSLHPRGAAAGAAWPGGFIAQFEASLDRCQTLSDLKPLVAEAAHELGFAYFALLHHRVLVDPDPRHIRIDTYPESWAGELALSYLPVTPDPVHQACTRTTAPFAWSDLPRLVRLSAAQSRLLARSRRHDLGQGVTVPVHVAGEPVGSCSFAAAGKTVVKPAARLAAELIGTRAFAAARRLRAWRPVAPSFPPRELECVRLVAAGKTDWEIGRILGISPETARQYVRRARARCDVATRTQLAIVAARAGLID